MNKIEICICRAFSLLANRYMESYQGDLLWEFRGACEELGRGEDCVMIFRKNGADNLERFRYSSADDFDEMVLNCESSLGWEIMLWFYPGELNKIGVKGRTEELYKKAVEILKGDFENIGRIGL